MAALDYNNPEGKTIDDILLINDPLEEQDKLAAGEIRLEDVTSAIALAEVPQETVPEIVRSRSGSLSAVATILDSLTMAPPATDEEVTDKPGDLKAFCQETHVPAGVAKILRKYNCETHDFAGPIGLKAIAASIILREDLDDTFYILDLMNTYRLYNAWKESLPRVTPFYAMKCCPEPSIVELLTELGAGFDCASAAEIQLALESGCKPDHIIFAHPCKRPSDIRFAKTKGVNLTTFDSTTELNKIAIHHNQTGCVLRIRADDPSAELPLGSKYGANMTEVDALLAEAKTLGLDIVGVSFHVGSMARDPNAFRIAIEQARIVFDKAEAAGFKNMHLLDIGGGFTGRFDSEGNVLSMKGDIPQAINAAIDKYFPDPKIRIISEPGRYFAEASMHLMTHVHGIRERNEAADQVDADVSFHLQIGDLSEQTDAQGKVTTATVPYNEYWISDGLYGSFNNIIYDHAVPRAWLMPSPQLGYIENPTTLIRSTVFGPSCDSLDVVFKDVLLPKLRVGDWLLFPCFGAYSLAGATNFNGIQAASCRKFYICSKKGVDEIDSLVMWACEMSSKPCSLVA